MARVGTRAGSAALGWLSRASFPVVGSAGVLGALGLGAAVSAYRMQAGDQSATEGFEPERGGWYQRFTTGIPGFGPGDWMAQHSGFVIPFNDRVREQEAALARGYQERESRLAKQATKRSSWDCWAIGIVGIVASRRSARGHQRHHGRFRTTTIRSTADPRRENDRLRAVAAVRTRATDEARRASG